MTEKPGAPTASYKPQSGAPTLQYRPPSTAATIWLIGRRAAIEALQDRLSLMMGVGFAVVLPIILVLVAVRPFGSGEPGVADMLAFYVLVVGLLPTISAIGIASGQFAGEKERGILTPLLASPASNFAIFGGKVLGAILPPLVYAIVGELVYLLSLAALVSPTEVALLPLTLSLTMLALVPAVACFAASVASLISSRVRTYNAAQQVGGLVLMPVWGIVFALAAKLSDWGPAGMIGLLGGLVIVDVAVTGLAARTWRRQEVLAQR